MSRKPNHPNFIPKYSREQKQVFFETLREMNGDVRAASKKCGLSVSCTRYWIAKANTADLSEETQKIVREYKGNIDARLEKLLFKIFACAEKNVHKATLPQQLEAASKIVTMLKGIRNPPRETPPPGPEQTTAEMEALAIIERVQRRRDQQMNEVSEKPN